MKSVLKTHIPSIAIVTGILGVLFLFSGQKNQDQTKHLTPDQERLINIPGMDWDNRFDLTLLHDVLDIFEPQHKAAHDALIQSIEQIRTQQIEALSGQISAVKPLNGARLWELLIMYMRFIAIYILVMLITYYGVQTMAVFRFVLDRQNRPGHLQRLLWLLTHPPALRNTRERLRYGANILAIPIKMLGKGLLYMILFAPAYVVAYSFKTNFETSSVLFMIILGVLSNGLLINYANKFFALLSTESQKGYVETARVKNLHESFEFNTTEGIYFKQIFQPRKNFNGHILQHIYQNASFQYLSTIKEQASFLITGLMIIEMALNIHEHLSYELLKQLLYKNYPEVILMVLGIFYLVKGTDIFADWLQEKATKKTETINE